MRESDGRSSSVHTWQEGPHRLNRQTISLLFFSLSFNSGVDTWEEGTGMLVILPCIWDIAGFPCLSPFFHKDIVRFC